MSKRRAKASSARIEEGVSQRGAVRRVETALMAGSLSGHSRGPGMVERAAAEIEMWHRFWSKVRIGDGCWEWSGGRDSCGRGAFRMAGVQVGAHRASWVLERGAIPAGLHVLHRCDNPACVRPSHLFLGTHKDNMADRNAKGRQARGHVVASSKITEDGVRSIRGRVSAGESLRAVARDVGITHATVQHIVSRRTWRHVP